MDRSDVFLDMGLTPLCMIMTLLTQNIVRIRVADGLYIVFVEPTGSFLADNWIALAWLFLTVLAVLDIYIANLSTKVISSMEVELTSVEKIDGKQMFEMGFAYTMGFYFLPIGLTLVGMRTLAVLLLFVMRLYALNSDICYLHPMVVLMGFKAYDAKVGNDSILVLSKTPVKDGYTRWFGISNRAIIATERRS